MIALATVTGAQVGFYLLAIIMVIAALTMVAVRKAVHSAICLAVVMVCLAIQYAVLQAPFLFAVQIIVYTGAILMLFLFVLMLVGVDTSDSLVETIKGQRVWAGLGFLGLLILLLVAVGTGVTAPDAGLTGANAGGNVQGVAALLFNRYVFVFEATAALLITAALGAMVLAHRERLRPKKSQAELAGERMARYAEEGEHPGPLPTPGVFARHNAVDTPALLPDGSAAPRSVSTTLRLRGAIQDAQTLAAPTARTLRAIRSDGTEQGLVEPGEDQPGDTTPETGQEAGSVEPDATNREVEQ